MTAPLQFQTWTKLVIVLLLSLANSSEALLQPSSINRARTLQVSSTSTSFAEANFKDDSYSVATLLLGTLLEARKAELDSSIGGVLNRVIGSFQGKQQRQSERIQEYIQLLLDMPRHTYDPSKSLFGPLYCTLYNYNPTNPNQDAPLWERISLKPENLKGQQYFVNADYEMSIINYAEIFGSSVAVRAKATFSPVKKQSTEKSSPSTSSAWLQGLNPTKSPSKAADLDAGPPSTLRTCPDVYNVRAFAGEVVLGDLVLPLSIEGTAKLVVLYADPRLRIFVSTDRSDSAVGAWEQAGVVVVQVRSDLVTGAAPIDLRA
jgi:hypothetical protein